MRSFSWVCMAVLGFVVLVVAGIVTAQMPDQDEWVIKPDVYKHYNRPLVRFNHTAHLDDYGYDCIECHHLFKGGENVWEEGDPTQCSQCHTETTTKNEMRLPIPKQKLNLKLAYHGKCIGCHRKYNHENHTDAAPIRCQDCHTEKE